MKRWQVTGLSLCFSVLLLTACTSSKPPDTEPEETDMAEELNMESQKPVNEPEEPLLDEQHPLTGEATEEVSPVQPFAVTINNHEAARPQSGIAQADIVYEVLTEGKQTRFLALFQSEQPTEIGPVRSARDYFIQLAQGYDALLVIHGWSPEAKRILGSGTVPFLNGLYHDNTLFKRSSERKAPHNSYISYGDAREGLETKGYDMEGDIPQVSFVEEDSARSFQRESGETADIRYGDRYAVQYQYNRDEAHYERASNQKASLDKLSQAQVTADNVFIIEASHQVIDEKGRRNIDLTSGGQGVLLQNGEALRVDWVNKEGRILPEKDGMEIAFIPGKTWINVVPLHPGLTESVSIK
ncbi:DUF3048 domain-containing protein [Bacillus piscicola]|uniref:DUF3048 domain-containing protein n=1 Tax=Bacillus piscicola TaxID=1632684 RepID=UPI001F0921A0|nr:DUF3048 domain-containing protein [Bacillus piscicola]